MYSLANALNSMLVQLTLCKEKYPECAMPTDTSRKANVIITSKQRCDRVLV